MTDCFFFFQNITRNKKGAQPVPVASEILTAGSFAVVAEVALLGLHSYARLLPHLVDLRHAQFRVLTKEETSVQNCQVVLVPVPKILQVLVVDGGERVHSEKLKEIKKEVTTTACEQA